MSTTAIPIMYTPSISISIWNASKPLLNYCDKLQVTTHHSLFPEFCTSKSESHHHQTREFKIIIMIMIIHSAGNNKSDSSKQQFHNMDRNRPYNKTKYTTCRVFCTFSNRPISASIIFNASNMGVNFFLQ